MLQIRNVTKTYVTHKVKVEALKGISLDFKETGLFFIVGKSGSGKSTLLNILGGLDKMSSGEIVIDGKSTNHFSSQDFDAFRNYYVGFIFQDFNLIDEISVYDNIALALKIQTKDHDTNTIEDALKMVGLEGLGYRKPNELSGGQRQRVSIARALVKDPKIILADEPTGALDSKTGEQLIVTLKTLSKHKLIIVVTHDEEMALNYGDEIIEIKDGLVYNHFISNDDSSLNNKEDVLENLVKYHAGKEILNKEEIESKLKEEQTNYVCINTSKEIVSLAYSDSFPYLYERKEISNRFKAIDNLASSEVKRSEEKKLKNKAHIRLKECFKMAIQSFKRKKRRFTSLVVISISSLYLFGLGWLFSTINVPNIVASKSNETNLPISYISQSEDDYMYGNKVVFDEIDIKRMEEKYNLNLSSSYLSNLKHAKVANDSSSLFALNYFSGIIESNDVEEFGFKVEGKSQLEEKEIIITDYAASELVRTGYIGKKDGVISTLFPLEQEEVLNSSLAFIGNDNEYYFFEIVGIIDTDYEKYLSLITMDYYSSILSEDLDKFEILQEYVYSKIYAKEGFIQDNSLLFNRYISGDLILDLEYQYKDYTMEQAIYYYYDDYSHPIIKLNELKNREVLYGTIPDKLEKNEIIINYSQIQYYIENDYYTLAEFMEVLKVKTLSFNEYKNNGGLINKIEENLKIVAVIDDQNSDEDNLLVVSDELYLSFIKKINSVQITDLVFSLPKGVDAKERLLKKFYENGYEIGEVVNVSSIIEDLVDIIGPVCIGIAAFFSIFAFLIVYSFLSSSVRERKKEIGILRSMGARNSDVLKIFGTEIILMGTLITMVSLIFITFTVNSINGTINNLISLTIFKDFFIYLVCLLFLIIASILPLIRILKHNPIDAIKRVY